MSKLEWQMLAAYLFMMLAMLAIGLALSSDSSREEEVKCAQATVDAKQDIRLEQLEKDIRILKTDVHILQYGVADEETDNSR